METDKQYQPVTSAPRSASLADEEPAGVPVLQDAIRRQLGCTSTLVERVKIDEMRHGTLVWSGEVSVFELIDCPKAKRAYAWLCPQPGGEPRVSVLLHSRDVNEPRAAVRAALAAEADKSPEAGPAE